MSLLKVPMVDKHTAVDLFCGCGGLTVGLKKAGFDVIGALDVDPLSLKTYSANHHSTKIFAHDIRNISAKRFARELSLCPGELDLLAGCPPCQGFSSIRTLNGRIKVNDPGKDLLYEFLRFVKVLRPKSVMLENVPGLANDPRFVDFFQKMQMQGYVGDYKVLDASNYDVPQRRRRLIYMAGYGFAVSFAGISKTQLTVRDSIGSLSAAGKSGDPMHDMLEKRTSRVRELIQLIPKDGGSRTDLPHDYWLDCHKRCNGFKDVYGRMAWDAPAPTITGGCFNPSKGRFLHPEENRAITMREAALLQGFPRDYIFPETRSKSAVAQMIGNALPPPFIAHHAKPIVKLLAGFRCQER